MAEIVNLRQARKAKQRADAASQADANRARHGASTAERRLAKDEADRLARTVDGARREPD
ncbi:hypothetical protein HNO88_000798 [Novosphingobium chloroacetimidivorans]|uniref:DUF4169 family protein n=1 Tax=Novosphingobium chloroacetimidivorans TaxID=1428314 RepID=A0A7W7K7V6_9SPHN|nr:DUF4169 family protein [Novosphingobium chloroacetimidivorans]MBB4857491.1 hypothetical protein [Novosphingobium chloroacetimidivorans]